ncbi:MAG: hypothetical protein NVS4B8_02580 [Herpetosiphon sp.]
MPVSREENMREHLRIEPTPLRTTLGLFHWAPPLREAVLALKYRRHSVLVTALAALAIAQADVVLPDADAVIAVPLHRRRERERGFNQAALLARQIGPALGLPPLRDGLVRIKPTAHQTELTAEQRRSNVQSGFEWQGATMPERIILFDDVLTTGATMGACAHALLRAGAREVHGVALARGGL